MSFVSTSGASLWSVEAIKEMCKFDNNLVLNSNYASGNGCPSHSVGYYIGELRNKDCEQLDENDLAVTMQVKYQEFLTNIKSKLVDQPMGILDNHCFGC